MNRALWLSAWLCALAGLLFVAIKLSAPPKAQAQGNGEQSPRVRVQRLGVVEIKQLPARRPSVSRGRQIPFRVADLDAFQREKQEANSQTAGASPAAVSIVPSLVTSPLGFIGLRFSDTAGYIPPDTHVAAGPNHLFETVNANGRIFDKTGNLIIDYDLFFFFLGDFFTDVISDPIVRYDAASGRWFASVVTVESLFGQGDWRLAVSATSDPTGSWIVYGVSTSGIFPDFPKVGISDDKVVLTGDAFTLPLQTATFRGTEFIVLNKTDLLNGVNSPAFTYFGPPQGLMTIEPAQSLSAVSTLFMASAGAGRRNSTLRVWSVTGVPTATTQATFTKVDLSIAALKIPPDALQMGTSTRIQTNDSRLLDAVYRNGSLWVAGNAACKPAGDTTTRSCMRFFQVSTGTLSITQDFTFGESGKYYYYPAIRTDSGNNLIAVFNRSSSSEFASVYASGQKTTDGLNTFETPILIHAGEAPYQPFASRWGDYSGAGVDPLNPATVWVAGEYARTEGGSEWGTWIASIHF